MKEWILIPVLLLPYALAGCSHKTVVAYAPLPPPQTLDEFAQRGYNEGFAAAKRDVSDGRPPALERHPRFRNPPVPASAFEDYRHGFRAGYNAFLHQGGSGGPGY